MSIEFKNFFKKNKNEEVKILPTSAEREKLDSSVDQALESMEGRVEDIKSLLNELGGPEAAEKTLKETSPERIKEIEEKMEEYLDAIGYHVGGIRESALMTELPVVLCTALAYLAFYLGGQGVVLAPFIGGAGGIPLFVAIHGVARDLIHDKTVGGIGQAIEVIKYKFRYKKLKEEKETLSN